MTTAPANEKSTSEDKWDHCPKCTGSFSFRKPVGNICPWCQQAISEPPVFSSGVRGNFSHTKKEALIHLSEDGTDDNGDPIMVNAFDHIRALRQQVAALKAIGEQE